MSSSFKKSATSRPPARYRTPSPPRNYLEPLSPPASPSAAINGWGGRRAENCPSSGSVDQASGFDQRKLGATPLKNHGRGSMDVFASIALATRSTSPDAPLYNAHLTKRNLSDYQDTERSIKRARSERTLSPDWKMRTSSSLIRPTTSYEHSQESRMMEAELLLNFSQRAMKAWSPQSSPQTMIQPCTVTSDAQSDSDRLVLQEHLAACGIEGASIKTCQNTQEVELNPGSRTTRAASAAESRTSAKDIAPSPRVVSAAHGTDLIDSETAAHRIDQHRSDELLEVSPDHHLPPGKSIETQPRDFVDQLRSHADAVQDTFRTENVSNDSRGDEETFSDLVKPCTLEESHVYGSLDTASHTIHDNQTESKDVGFVPDSGDSARYIRTHEARGEAIQDAGQSQNIPSVLDTKADSAAVEILPFSEAENYAAAGLAVCAQCKFARNSHSVDPENNSTSWISCDACKSWFHFACAGFKNEREVRGVDKFRCPKCRPLHGSTTYVRKSARAHSAIDYAGLHQGVIKTSDERPEHHYIQPIKDGTINFLPESFARMRPELVTAEYFEKGVGMKEPIVIPAALNPRPKVSGHSSTQTDQCPADPGECSSVVEEPCVPEDWFPQDSESRIVPDEGQDALDMIIPQGLTVRQVAEIYGPEEKVEVIDVKSQNGENKKWNMRRWADYYENSNNKVVRNVISLEVSQSKLGRLIRRPRIVRDLDLQDSVWPSDLLAKGEYPRVQFYCLMSVADCFTDFHIDFGGSSVFYHILKGKKTFLFIPPKEKHLKKYEEWCMSPAQNWTFLADQTKECYRVDLCEGDTMLIPAGWIHAVWTPEDSLVIGGNFLTRMNFAMQLRIAQVEKATGVARKFRYPNFQKLHWYTAIRYLEDDPLPYHVRELLERGGIFHRTQPAHCEFDAWGENSRPAAENYHARYYSQPELEGLPDLTRYLLRTALIDIGNITDGISAETRNAVKKSIPRGHGEPLDLVKTFAVWCAWKRGNEPIPHWAYPDAVPESVAPDKLSATASRKMDREAALQAPRRQSARTQSQQQNQTIVSLSIDPSIGNLSDGSDCSGPNDTKRGSSDVNAATHTGPERNTKQHGSASSVTSGSHRKTACESCRRRRRACKHKDEVEASNFATHNVTNTSFERGLSIIESNNGLQIKLNEIGSLFKQPPEVIVEQSPAEIMAPKAHTPQQDPATPTAGESSSKLEPTPKTDSSSKTALQAIHKDHVKGLVAGSGNSMHTRPRTKACNDCRKSKRRCIHDAFGNEDPVKVAETAIPRPHARKVNVQAKAEASTRMIPVQVPSNTSAVSYVPPAPNAVAAETALWRPAPVANMISAPLDVEKSSLPLSLPNIISNGSSLEENAHEQGSAPPEPSQAIANINSLDLIENIMCPDSNSEWAEDDLTGADEKTCELASSSVGPGTNSEAFAASSLVSPPASSHEDVGVSPPSSSRQSSLQPKQQQSRFTPDSGPIRRASSSSYDGKPNCSTSDIQQRVTLAYGYQGQSKQESPSSVARDSASVQRKGRIEADEESLKLIKELQANDLGLRRRGRG